MTMSWVLIVVVVIVTMYIIDTQCWKSWVKYAKDFVSSDSKESFDVRDCRRTGSRERPVRGDRNITKNRAWTPPSDETVSPSVVDQPESNEKVFGGKSYADYIKDTAVSQAVQKNHMSFVNERTQNGQWTGKTFTVDSHDSYDPTPWVGLRKPRAVPVGTPDRVHDVDESLFERHNTLRW